jgi:hypothetical protein
MQTGVESDIIVRPTSPCESLHSEKPSDGARLSPPGAGASRHILGLRRFVQLSNGSLVIELIATAVSLTQEIASHGQVQRCPLGAEIYQVGRHQTEERALESGSAAEQGLLCACGSL